MGWSALALSSSVVINACSVTVGDLCPALVLQATIA